MPSASFWTTYRKAVEELFSPLEPTDGVPEADVTAAESRLGLGLPGLLRELYVTAGARRDLHQAHDHLLSPSDLHEEGGKLIFYEENQAVVVWGFEVALAGERDVPVLQGNGTDELDWYPECDRLSDFLMTLVYWQAVNGGMSHTAAAEVPAETLAVIQQHWRAIPLGGVETSEMRVFASPGQALCLLGGGDSQPLLAGARTVEDASQIDEKLGLTLHFRARQRE